MTDSRPDGKARERLHGEPEERADGKARERPHGEPEERADGKAGEGDARTHEATGNDEAAATAFSRRGLLQAGASLGIAAGTAGCTGLGNVTSYQFNAIPATLDGEPDDPTYTLDRLSEQTVERTPEVMGTEIDVELTNQFALYDGTHDSLGLLSSPTATVATQPRNPLATDSLQTILTGDAGDRLMAAFDLTDQSSVQWTQGPQKVDSGSGQLLGQSTTIEAFAGVTQEFGFVLVTAARVTESDDAVIVATALERDGQAPALVGSNGYVTSQTVTESVQRVQAVLPLVERGGAGLELKESARITTQGDEPDYVRVLASNQYDDRTLFSITLTTQLFDDQGTFLDHRIARLPRLGPDEQFEGYLPYVTDDVAGYAVDADHSARQISTESSDDVVVTDDGLDDDTVTVGIRNTLNRQVPFVSLEVTYYDGDGNVLSVSERTVADLDAGESRRLDVVYTPPAFESPASIEDYSVDVVEYAGTMRYVR